MEFLECFMSLWGRTYFSNVLLTRLRNVGRQWTSSGKIISRRPCFFFGGGGLLLSFLMFNFSSFLFPIIYLSFPEKKNKTCTCLKNPRFLLFFSVSFGLSHPLLPLLKVYLAVLAVHTYIHHRFMDQEDLEFWPLSCTTVGKGFDLEEVAETRQTLMFYPPAGLSSSLTAVTARKKCSVGVGQLGS